MKYIITERKREHRKYPAIPEYNLKVGPKIVLRAALWSEVSGYVAEHIQPGDTIEERHIGCEPAIQTYEERMESLRKTAEFLEEDE